jgi:hypothetical protein
MFQKLSTHFMNSAESGFDGGISIALSSRANSARQQTTGVMPWVMSAANQ